MLIRRRRRTTLLNMVDHTMTPSRTRLGRTTATPVMDPRMGTLTGHPHLRLTEDTPDRLADIMVAGRTGESTRMVLPALLLTPSTETTPSLLTASAAILSA